HQQRILEIRLHGMSALAVDRFASDKHNHWDINRLGTKANLSDILAALLPQRQKVAERYREAFGNGPLRLSREVPDTKCAEHIFPSGVPNGRRDEAIARLNEAGIHVTVSFRSVPGTRYYSRKYPDASVQCPSARLWCQQTLTLPMYPSLAQNELDYVIR